MGIPFATTTISIVRDNLAGLQDPYDDPSQYPIPATSTVASGIRAVIKPPTANVNLTIGDRVVLESQLICDPCDLREGDYVTEASGRIWLALGPSPWGAFFLSGMQATLRIVQSFAE